MHSEMQYNTIICITPYNVIQTSFLLFYGYTVFTHIPIDMKIYDRLCGPDMNLFGGGYSSMKKIMFSSEVSDIHLLGGD